MLRIILAIAILALTACGAQETTTTQTPGAASEVGESGGSAPVEAAQEAAVSFPQVERCLDLIREAAFARALPVCLEALDLDPQNQQVQAAVNQARTEVAKLEGATAAAQEAAGAAAGDAASQLEEETQALPKGLGE